VAQGPDRSAHREGVRLHQRGHPAARAPLAAAPRRIGQGSEFLFHYLTDEQMAKHADLSKMVALTGAAGTTILIDSQTAYHLGSRCQEPRLAYVAYFSSGSAIGTGKPDGPWTPSSRGASPRCNATRSVRSRPEAGSAASPPRQSGFLFALRQWRSSPARLGCRCSVVAKCSAASTSGRASRHRELAIDLGPRVVIQRGAALMRGRGVAFASRMAVGSALTS